MKESIINFDNIAADVRSLTSKARTFRSKLQKTFNDNNLRKRISPMLESLGYDFNISDNGDLFKIGVNPHFMIFGLLDNRVYKLGIMFAYDKMGCDSKDAHAGLIDLDVERIERYAPVLSKIIELGKELTAKYDVYAAREAEAARLDILVKEAMVARGFEDVIVKPDLNHSSGFIIKKQLWDKIYRSGYKSLFMYAPVDFSNYLAVCDQFAESLSSIPSKFLKMSGIFVMRDSLWLLREKIDIEKSAFIDTTILTGDLKMVYSKDMSGRSNGNARPGKITTALDRLGYIYSYDEPTNSYVICLNRNVRLVYDANTIRFRLNLSKLQCECKEKEIDDNGVVTLLQLLALASQDGGLRISNLLEINPNDYNSFLDILLPILNGLFPIGWTLTSYGSLVLFGQDYAIKFTSEHLNTFFDNILTLATNHDMLNQLPKLWKGEPEESWPDIVEDTDHGHLSFKRGNLWDLKL